MRKIIVSPSILSADFNNLKNELAILENAGAEWVHFDIMDGHFVPNISFGMPVLKSVAKSHHMFNDVHIMISDPLTYGHQFARAGADLVTFHYEAVDKCDVKKVIESIKNAHCKVGLSIKPNTNVEEILEYLKDLDLVLVMSVEPGFGGQKFIDSSLNKIKVLREYIDKNRLSTLIEVDGGINDETAKLCVNSGADVLVAGSYLFNKEDIGKRIKKLMGE